MHAKSIGRAMKRMQMKSATAIEKRGRPKKYGVDVHAALCTVWEELGCPCAENMTHKFIDELAIALSIPYPINASE